MQIVVDFFRQNWTEILSGLVTSGILAILVWIWKSGGRKIAKLKDEIREAQELFDEIVTFFKGQEPQYAKTAYIRYVEFRLGHFQQLWHEIQYDLRNVQFEAVVFMSCAILGGLGKSSTLIAVGVVSFIISMVRVVVLHYKSSVLSLKIHNIFVAVKKLSFDDHQRNLK